MTIAREATAGVISGLTFGLVSQETISKGLTATGQFFKDLLAGVPSMDEIKEFSTKAFNNTKDFFKNVFDQVPSMDELKTTFKEEGFLAAAGDFFELSNVSGTGFTVHFKNGTSDIDRNFSYQAIGFGKGVPT